jgi:rubredoxin
MTANGAAETRNVKGITPATRWFVLSHDLQCPATKANGNQPPR